MKYLLAAAALIAALGTAAPAAADANDEQFLNTLTLHEMGCTPISFMDCGPRGEQGLTTRGIQREEVLDAAENNAALRGRFTTGAWLVSSD
jgi:hypothetical protein